MLTACDYLILEALTTALKAAGHIPESGQLRFQTAHQLCRAMHELRHLPECVDVPMVSGLLCWEEAIVNLPLERTVLMLPDGSPVFAYRLNPSVGPGVHPLMLAA